MKKETSMKKMVINCSFGGFNYTPKVLEGLHNLGFEGDAPERDNPLLVQVVEELIAQSENGIHYEGYSSLKVIEIPDDIEYTIMEDQGREHVVETDRVWY